MCSIEIKSVYKKHNLARIDFYSVSMNRRNFLIKSSFIFIAVGFGSVFWPNRWRYIVVHHSAGSYGDIEFLKKVHRGRQASDPIDAIPYHFIFGNGNGLGMGEVASD